MTTLYDPHKQAAKQGWTVVHKAEVRGDGAQAPGFVTLCRTEDTHMPFAVHFFNAQDGGFHSGRYCLSEDGAAEAYAAAVKRYTRHHHR